MPYTPPAGSSAGFNFRLVYTPPSGSSAGYDFRENPGYQPPAGDEVAADPERDCRPPDSHSPCQLRRTPVTGIRSQTRSRPF